MLEVRAYDETRDMDLKAGSWRKFVFSQPPEVDQPTYEIVGETERVDARDYIFARIAMDEGSDWYNEYYGRHPELKESDDRSRQRGRQLGEKLLQENPITEQMAISTFSRAWIFGRPDSFRPSARMKVMPTGAKLEPPEGHP